MPSDQLDRLSIDKTHSTRTSSPKSWLKKVIMLVAALAAVALAMFFMRSRPVTVETTSVVQVYPTQSFTSLNASGYVVAQRRAAVASKITGRLEWLGVEEGSKVTSGQIIARLENRDLDAAVKQGEAALQNAKAVLEQGKAELDDASQAYRRQSELLKQGIVARADFDAAEARYRRARSAVSGAEAGVRNTAAALNGARTNYDYSLIRAPFDAVVLTKNADVGDIITPLGAAANAKAAVFTIADLSSLEVEADVSESNLAMVKRGQACMITLDAIPSRRFRGVVHTIVPTADRSKASVLVKVRFVDNYEGVLPEMSAKVAFLEREARADEQEPRLAVNAAAITTRGSRAGIYRVMDGRSVFTPVGAGRRFGELVEISGVKSGEKVVLKPLDKLKDGSKVRVEEKK